MQKKPFAYFMPICAAYIGFIYYSNSKLYNKTLSKADKNTLSKQQEQEKIIITTAFKDRGITRPVHVNFNDQPGYMKVTSIIDKNGKHAAYVEVRNNIHALPAVQIYAIAGHQASHIYYGNDFTSCGLKSLTALIVATFSKAATFNYFNKPGVFNFNYRFILPNFAFLLGAGLSFTYFSPQISKLYQAFADIDSARHLGTRRPLVQFFESKLDQSAPSAHDWAPLTRAIYTNFFGKKPNEIMPLPDKKIIKNVGEQIKKRI